MKAIYKEVSPMYNVGDDTPPTLLLLGTKDPFLSVPKAQEYCSILENKGIDWELKLYHGAGHPIFYFRKDYTPECFQVLKDSEEFLSKHGYLNN